MARDNLTEGLQRRLDVARRKAVERGGSELVRRIESGAFEAEQRRLAEALCNDPERLRERLHTGLNNYQRDAIISAVAGEVGEDAAAAMSHAELITARLKQIHNDEARHEERQDAWRVLVCVFADPSRNQQDIADACAHARDAGLSPLEILAAYEEGVANA